jgi:hypothetical protein
MKSANKSLISGNTAIFEEVIAIIERARENAFRVYKHSNYLTVCTNIVIT